MTITEFIDSLDLPYEGERQTDSRYLINLNSSDEFSEVFDKISLNKSLTCDNDSIATDERSEFRFTDGYFEVELKADFENDEYTVVIEEK